MHFQGQQLVSRATHLSARSLVALSAAVVLAELVGIDLCGFSLLGIEPGSKLWPVAAAVIVFLAVGHLLNWIGDRHAFQAWNSETKITGSSIIDLGGTPLRSEISEALSRIGGMKDTLKGIEEQPENAERNAEQMESLGTQLGDVDARLTRLSRSVDRLTMHARLYLYGWLLIVPAGLAAWAFSIALMQEPAPCPSSSPP